MNSVSATIPAPVAAEISGIGSFFGSCQIASSNFGDFDAKLQTAMEESLSFSAVLKNFDQQQKDLKNDELLNYPLREDKSPFQLFMQQNEEESEVMLQLKAILGDEAGAEAFDRIVALLEKGCLSVQKDMDNLEAQDFEYLAKFLLGRLELAIKQITALSGETEAPQPNENPGFEETEREAFLNILIDLLKTGIITPQTFEHTLHNPETSDVIDLFKELKEEVKKLLAALEKAIEEPVEPEAKPELETKAEIKPQARQEIKPELELEAKAEIKPQARQEIKPEQEAKAETEIKPQARQEIKPELEAKAEIKPQARPETKPELEAKTETEIKPEARLEIKPELEAKTEIKPQARPEIKPELEAKAETEIKPQARPEIKPELEAKAETEIKPEARPEIKLEAKAETETRPEARQETTLEAKAEIRPADIKPEIIAETRPNRKQEAKAETEARPETRPEIKQEAKAETEIRLANTKPEIMAEARPNIKQEAKAETEARPADIKPEFKTEIKPANIKPEFSQVAAKAEPEVRVVWEGGDLKIETVNPKTGEKLQSIPTTGSMVRMQERINEFEVVRQVIAQAKFIKTPMGEQRMTLQLHPEHLGQLNLRINLNNGEMQIHARVESATAQAALENHIGLLREGLEKQGINLERLEVSIEQREAFKEKQKRDSENKDGKRKGRESMHLAVSVASDQNSDTGRRLGYNTMEYLA